MSETSSDALRTLGKQARRSLGKDERARRSTIIGSNFLRSNLFFNCKNIACYLSAADEVDTSMVFQRAWRAGKTVFSPVVGDDFSMRFVEITPSTRLEKNRFDLWEPAFGAEIRAERLDVVVTPVVVFDAQRHRIGMGGGYFDRAFSFLNTKKQNPRPKLAGFAFDCQKVEKITPNRWDIRLYRVFNESL